VRLIVNGARNQQRGSWPTIYPAICPVTLELQWYFRIELSPNERTLSMPRVSIITPTLNREDLLPALWRCVRAQSVQDIEWIVHDGSPERARMFDEIGDPRVRYLHVPEPMTIGAKRNALCDAAKGEIIAHFDDDDFYGPRYIEGMVSLMAEKSVDFVKLFGFFLYHRTQHVFAYWDLERDFPIHWHLEPDTPPYPEQNNGYMSGRWGYGFSYVFHRRLWEAVHFPDQNFGEDQVFADAVVDRFGAAGKQDFAYSCIHVIHRNLSISYPQQILPKALLPELFPDFPLSDY
jgi:glycosyltransferase involved in cell wall biosynthesis